METNFSGYCLYREIGSATLGMGIPMGIPSGMGKGLKSNPHGRSSPIKWRPESKIANLRTRRHKLPAAPQNGLEKMNRVQLCLVSQKQRESFPRSVRSCDDRSSCRHRSPAFR